MDQHFCQKTIKIQAWRHQDRDLEGSGAGLEASWAILGHPGRLWKRLGPSWKRLGSLPDRFGPKKVANMAPRWLPKRKPNLLKTNLKIDHLFDATWNRHLSIFFDFGNQKPNHVGSKIHSIIDFILTNPEGPKRL